MDTEVAEMAGCDCHRQIDASSDQYELREWHRWIHRLWQGAIVSGK
ncbi:hypothetical protein [Streptomyces cellostaticus]|nr:hypothetical protein [Streptomyces cellostaticus]